MYIFLFLSSILGKTPKLLLPDLLCFLQIFDRSWRYQNGNAFKTYVLRNLYNQVYIISHLLRKGIG